MKNLSLADLMSQAEALTQQGQSDQVVPLYQNWLKVHTKDPLRGIAWFNMGTLLSAQKRLPEAVAAYQQALQVQPQLFQARLNLGHALENQGQTDAAIAEWRRAVAELDTLAQPDPALQIHALNNLARVLETAKRYDEAEVCMLRSLQIDPEQGAVLHHYIHLRQKQCQWPVYQTLPGVGLNRQLLATSSLAMLAAHDDPALQLMVAREFVHAKVRPTAPRRPRQVKAPGEKIRVAYLSGDLCMHAVGLLTVELFELHDRERFEVFAFCWSQDDGSPLRERIIKAFDHHIRIGHLTDEQAAQLIEACGIDILVDLQGLTSGARPNILTYRPAGAVQISYLGLPATSALPSVDYILADDFVYPVALEPFMTELPLRVPGCYQVSDRRRAVGEPLTRQACGLPEQGFVFAAFNNTYKITPEVFRAWMRILQQVPDSVLWLMVDNRWAEAHLRAEVQAHGVALERIVFTGRATPTEYMARLAVPDLFLDTFPYNAGTTANDILWMGTPILTWSGKSYISRMCGSLLTAVGLSDLVTENLEDYVRKAVLLGSQPQRVASHKRYLREHGRQSPLFDVPQRVRGIESAFLEVLGLTA